MNVSIVKWKMKKKKCLGNDVSIKKNGLIGKPKVLITVLTAIYNY